VRACLRVSQNSSLPSSSSLVGSAPRPRATTCKGSISSRGLRWDLVRDWMQRNRKED
jgi:hypothetical protein